MTDPWRFSAGVHAVVSGGTKGLGVSIVEELCAKGAQVFTCARRERSLSDKISLWKSNGYNVEGVVADLSTSSGRYAFAYAIRTWLKGKPLDILVNNFGLISNNQSDDSHENWESNFLSMFILTSLCHDHLKREPGSAKTNSVVNIASIQGMISSETNAPYPTAMLAITKITGNLARDWGPDGIRVNCVAPWLISSESDEYALFPAERKMLELAPLGRKGETKEVAGLVTFLCLPIAGYISGQVICVDGGWMPTQTLLETAGAMSSKKESSSHLSLPQKPAAMLRQTAGAMSSQKKSSSHLSLPQKSTDMLLQTVVDMASKKEASSNLSLPEMSAETLPQTSVDTSLKKKSSSYSSLPQMSADTLRRTAVDMSSKKKSSSLLSLQGLEEACRKLRENTALDVDYFESHKSLFRARKESRTDEEVKTTNAKWEKFRNSKRWARAGVESRDDVDSSPLEPVLSTTERGRNRNKSVRWQMTPERESLRPPPLASIEVPQPLEHYELVEADSEISEPVNHDLKCIQSFRERLRRIQDKKNLRKNLRQRTGSLRCVFPSTSGSELVKELYADGMEGPADISERFEQRTS